MLKSSTCVNLRPGGASFTAHLRQDGSRGRSPHHSNPRGEIICHVPKIGTIGMRSCEMRRMKMKALAQGPNVTRRARSAIDEFQPGLNGIDVIQPERCAWDAIQWAPD